MNEAVTTVANAPIGNIIAIGVIFLIALILVIIFGPWFARKIGLKKIGKIELKEDQIRNIQNDTTINVHEIQRKQLNYLDTYIITTNDIINKHVDSLGYCHLEFNIVYVIEKLYDEIITWIMFNSITNTADYKEQHFDKLWLVYRKSIMEVLDMHNSSEKVIFNGKAILRKECAIDWLDSFFQSEVKRMAYDVIESFVKIKKSNAFL